LAESTGRNGMTMMILFNSRKRCLLPSAFCLLSLYRSPHFSFFCRIWKYGVEGGRTSST
jgi:hypothetical protein